MSNRSIWVVSVLVSLVAFLGADPAYAAGCCVCTQPCTGAVCVGTQNGDAVCPDLCAAEGCQTTGQGYLDFVGGSSTCTDSRCVAQTSTPTATPTSTGTNTPTATPTGTGTNTPTAANTPTATASPTSTLTPTLTPTPSTEDEPAGGCSDRIDNDGDKLIDCEDPDCFGNNACSTGAPALDPSNLILLALLLGAFAVYSLRRRA